jgi:hypothetical protein
MNALPMKMPNASNWPRASLESISIICAQPLADAGFHYVETLDDLGEFNGIDCRNRD